MIGARETTNAIKLFERSRKRDEDFAYVRHIAGELAAKTAVTLYTIDDSENWYVEGRLPADFKKSEPWQRYLQERTS